MFINKEHSANNLYKYSRSSIVFNQLLSGLSIFLSLVMSAILGIYIYANRMDNISLIMSSVFDWIIVVMATIYNIIYATQIKKNRKTNTPLFVVFNSVLIVIATIRVCLLIILLDEYVPFTIPDGMNNTLFHFCMCAVLLVMVSWILCYMVENFKFFTFEPTQIRDKTFKNNKHQSHILSTKIFFNKSTWIAFVFLLFKTIVNIVGLLALMMLGSFIASLDREWWVYLVLLVIIAATVLFLPLLSLVQNYFITKSKYFIFENITFVMGNKIYLRPHLLTDLKFQKKKAFFTNQMYTNVLEIFDSVAGFISTFIMMLANVVVISTWIDPCYLAGIILSFLFVSLLMRKTTKGIVARSISIQRKEEHVLLSLTSGWTTALVGNLTNWFNWKKEFTNQIFGLRKSSTNARIYFDIIEFTITLVSVLPIIGIDIFIMWEHQWDLNTIVLVAVTLSTQISIASNVQSVILNGVDCNVSIKRLDEVAHTLQNDTSKDIYMKKIEFKKISIWCENHKLGIIKSLHHLSDLTNGFLPGNYILRGGNGTGKSLLFSLIKEKYREKILLLPVKADLFIVNNNVSESEGEKEIHQLNNFFTKTDLSKYKILLLDEWDANLDKEHIRKIENYIHKMSMKTCIISIRHRTDVKTTG
ncbi:MAG: hypothetical protein LBS76_01295 [Mycoplasmataceae bacterium]|nr:hypothetical protein [Mycoplasmataceae bacterium]